MPAGGAHPPVILFLHGTGERGSDGTKPDAVGLGPHVRAHAADFPALVAFPQAPDEPANGRRAQPHMAFAALDAGHDLSSTATPADLPDRCRWVAMAVGTRTAAAATLCRAGADLRCAAATRDERDLYVTPLAGDADPFAALAARLRHDADLDLPWREG